MSCGSIGSSMCLQRIFDPVNPARLYRPYKKAIPLSLSLVAARYYSSCDIVLPYIIEHTTPAHVSQFSKTPTRLHPSRKMVFSLFKSSKQESSAQNADPKFDPNTLTMIQPGSPNAPTMNANGVVTEQPARQDEMSMHLRGGGGGGFCCGL
ncbi:hypothetical protein AN7329.2 [Aspergillus nidulans FGSC A4]|nr:hypothetical protein AN7329.2 [Aspergillus nidulans FGSC A4]|eukprot:XP_680598.1 hypothetical protein AN7329.2 [Aspergillus nidulans FGSC A4]